MLCFELLVGVLMFYWLGYRIEVIYFYIYKELFFCVCLLYIKSVG